jgi:hypothetical protein
MGERALEEHAAYVSHFHPEKMYGYASSLFLLAKVLPEPPAPSAARPEAVFTTESRSSISSAS